MQITGGKLVTSLFCCGITGVAGCDEVDGDPNIQTLVNGHEVADDNHLDFTPIDEEVTFRGYAENGTASNGTAINGRTLNGRTLNGRTLNGTSLGAALDAINGALTTLVHLNGTPLSNIQIVNGSLISAYDGSTTRLGAQLANTVFHVDFDPMGDGAIPMEFKISSVVQSAVQTGVYFHNVLQLNDNDDFVTLCKDGAGNPTQAIALAGTWDPETAIKQAGAGKFTWACRGAALAKAVEWGYLPWVDPVAHQAAMRMIRADYFGNGVTHTTNGNTIDVSDKWGIQVPDTNWTIEAKWGPNGAVCLSTPRKLSWPRSSMPEAAALPYCTNNGLANGTPNTDPSQYGGLLMTRVVPNDNPSAY